MSIIKVVSFDDGHGINTRGKRTPLFPSGKFMKENEFNWRVVDILRRDLEALYPNLIIQLVAPEFEDVSLRTRVKRANDLYRKLCKEHGKANVQHLYLSVHANAFGSGGWNNVGGIETYHYPNAETSGEYASILHANLLKGTKLANRGVKTADFYVLRKTLMEAVLVETAFMTNKREAQLLMTEEYRQECAHELGLGVAKCLNLTKPPVLYKVQTGAFSNRDNAVQLQQRLKAKGVESFITRG